MYGPIISDLEVLLVDLFDKDIAIRKDNSLVISNLLFF